MKIITKKIKINCAGMSCIGTGEERPVSFGNYFDMREGKNNIRILNFWWENLDSAQKKYLKDGLVQIRIYNNDIAIIDDDRIPKNWYNDKLCSTGYSGTVLTKEIAKDIFNYLGDPNNEYELYENPKSYYKKRGHAYKGGIVYNNAYEAKNGIIIYLPAKEQSQTKTLKRKTDVDTRNN